MKGKTNSLGSISKVSNLLIHLLFICVCLTCVYPILLILGTSLTDESTIAKYGYNVIPRVFSAAAYKSLINNGAQILNAYKVSIISTVTGTVACVLMTALFAYPLSRKEVKYRKFFTMFLFITMLFGGGLVPWYMVCSRLLHLNNSIYALIVPGLFSAYNVIIMRTFFQTTIPDEIVESAHIDGANDITIFARIIIPLSKPGLATIALFACVGKWNDWYNPMLFITNEKLINLPYYIQKIMSNLQYLAVSTNNSSLSGEAMRLPAEGTRMAVVLVTIGPIILAYPFLQRYFVKGLTIGAVKG